MKMGIWYMFSAYCVLYVDDILVVHHNSIGASNEIDHFNNFIHFDVLLISHVFLLFRTQRLLTRIVYATVTWYKYEYHHTALLMRVCQSDVWRRSNIGSRSDET